MNCLACGAAQLIRDTRDLPYSYKGETPLIPAVVGEWCPTCGEAMLNADESARASAAMLAFNKAVAA